MSYSETQSLTLAAAVAGYVDFNVPAARRAQIVIANTGAAEIGTVAISLSPHGTYFSAISAVGTAVGAITAGQSSLLIDLPLAAKTLRVTLTSTSGSSAVVEVRTIEDDSGDGQLRVGGNVVGGQSVTGAVAGTTLAASSLTAGRVPLVGTAGLLEDDAGLTYDKTADALAVTGTIAATGAITATGDLAAAGGFKRSIGPFYVTTAASQTAAAAKLGDTAGQAFVVPRAGSITGFSAMIDTAVTGAATSITAKLYKNGSLVNAALNLAFTQAGGETAAYAVAAKDAYAVAAGDKLTVVYDSTGISNTPKLVAFAEIEC